MREEERKGTGHICMHNVFLNNEQNFTQDVPRPLGLGESPSHFLCLAPSPPFSPISVLSSKISSSLPLSWQPLSSSEPSSLLMVKLWGEGGERGGEEGEGMEGGGEEGEGREGGGKEGGGGEGEGGGKEGGREKREGGSGRRRTFTER